MLFSEDTLSNGDLGTFIYEHRRKLRTPRDGGHVRVRGQVYVFVGVCLMIMYRRRYSLRRQRYLNLHTKLNLDSHGEALGGVAVVDSATATR